MGGAKKKARNEGEDAGDLGEGVRRRRRRQGSGRAGDRLREEWATTRGNQGGNRGGIRGGWAEEGGGGARRRGTSREGGRRKELGEWQ